MSCEFPNGNTRCPEWPRVKGRAAAVSRGTKEGRSFPVLFGPRDSSTRRGAARSPRQAPSAGRTSAGPTRSRWIERSRSELDAFIESNWDENRGPIRPHRSDGASRGLRSRCSSPASWSAPSKRSAAGPCSTRCPSTRRHRGVRADRRVPPGPTGVRRLSTTDRPGFGGRRLGSP